MPIMARRNFIHLSYRLNADANSSNLSLSISTLKLMFIGFGGIDGSAVISSPPVVNPTPFTEIRHESLTACMSFDFSIA